MKIHNRAISFAISAVSLSWWSIAPAFADRLVTCESYDYRYEYCRTPVRGEVRVEHEYSDSRCRQGQSWGYDRFGIWVARGCRAQFEIGHHSERDVRDNSDRDDSDLATALAVVGGLAVVGTVLATTSQMNTSSTHSSQTLYPNDRQNSFGGVPPWAVGTFAGYNPAYNTDLELTIYPSGGVSLYVDKTRLNGTYRNDQIQMEDGGILDVFQDDSGIKTVRRDPPETTVRYVRLR